MKLLERDKDGNLLIDPDTEQWVPTPAGKKAIGVLMVLIFILTPMLFYYDSSSESKIEPTLSRNSNLESNNTYKPKTEYDKVAGKYWNQTSHWTIEIVLNANKTGSTRTYLNSSWKPTENFTYQIKTSAYSNSPNTYRYVLTSIDVFGTRQFVIYSDQLGQIDGGGKQSTFYDRQ